MARKTDRLTARTVATITKSGRHADGGNLYLNVSSAGAKSWVFMYRFGGRQREMGLGAAATIGLAKARETATRYRQALQEGKDPLAIRDAPSAKTFGECAEEFIATMGAAWRNPKHRAQWSSTLATYAGKLKGKPIADVSTEDVLSVLKPIWSTKPETASRVRGRIEAILDAATSAGRRTGDNPARWRGHLANLLPRRTKASRGHHAALPLPKLSAFLEALRCRDAVAANALEFAILTAARSGEVLGAVWSEIDLEAKIWTIPGARMKAGRDHRIPLTPGAISILKRMQAIRMSEYVFPGARVNKPLSNMSLEMVLRRMKVEDATVHGFRSTFRDWAAEDTGFPSEVVEMALAHAIESKTEAAYRRGDLFAKRRQLMAAWDQVCANAKPNVVNLKRAADA